MTRKGENYMDVASPKQFLATCCDPTVAGSGLTFWTMPVATTVVGDGGPMARSRCTRRSDRQSAAVRQRAMARGTLTCFQRIHRRLRSMKPSPAARTRSATSNTGRFIYSPCNINMRRSLAGIPCDPYLYLKPGQPMLRSSHAKRSQLGGYVLTR
jgi:hypothetical protein